MTHATATRTAPIGAGPLHCALEDARDRGHLQALCRAVSCDAADVSSDGIHIDMLEVLELMRKRGYSLTHPRHPTTQRHRGRTTWLVDITMPAAGPSFTWAFDTPNTS
jgi:hypothetical protein